MKGHILDSSIQKSSGIITGDDNSRYTFAFSEWMESQHPAKGMRVDFQTEGALATSVYLAIGSTETISTPAISGSNNQETKIYKDIDQVPWFRRSDVCTILIVANFLTGGFFPGIIIVCGILFTGDVYYKTKLPTGDLKKWSSANRVLAYVLAAIFLILIASAIFSA